MKVFNQLGFLALLFFAACEKTDPHPKTDANLSQQEAAPDFAKAATIIPTYDRAKHLLTIEVKIIPGVHAYAPGEKIGRPVGIVVSEKNGWKIEGEVEIPKGEERTLASEKSMILTGDFSLKAKVIGGNGPIEGVVNLQVCTDRVCDRPRTHPFLIESASGKLP